MAGLANLLDRLVIPQECIYAFIRCIWNYNVYVVT